MAGMVVGCGNKIAIVNLSIESAVKGLNLEKSGYEGIFNRNVGRRTALWLEIRVTCLLSKIL